MTSFESGPFSTAAEPTSFAAAKKKSSSSKGKKGKKGMPGMPGMPGMDDEEEEELPPLFHGANAGPPNHMAEATRHWGRHTSENRCASCSGSILCTAAGRDRSSYGETSDHIDYLDACEE
eukprot:CAMPEP_0169371154 /NCGR_PEP_ID=MMETSP1017-20121227/35734_1 /TAXON_ID=342587 /ORGANISM="Karlodinium micrum, Strain CCMP2283" /LENGTH=119 /DNA_ID=CAMNT_0009469609 /DNA_START=153 /DNA_END=512 /DNA_ORIENTATION=-